MDQKTDSLEDWFATMTEQYGLEKAMRLRARLTVKKSTRHYNTKDHAGISLPVWNEKVRYDRTDHWRTVLPGIWSRKPKFPSTESNDAQTEYWLSICSVKTAGG